MKQPEKISIVISLYNEAESVNTFWLSLKKSLQTLKYNFEVIWVNDGSSDTTQSVITSIIEEDQQNIKQVAIEFSKNFGHESAMIAGIDHATGDAVICMDGDGQHPADKIETMIASYQQGSEIILMKRTERSDHNFFQKFFSKAFYKTLNALSTYKFQSNSSDFFLVSKNVAEVLRSHFREHNRFIRGFIQSLGFPLQVVEYAAPDRIAGKSKYSYFKLLKFAISVIFAFSKKPLRLSIWISLCFILFTVFLGGYSIYMFFFGNTPPSGYTTLILFMSLGFSLLFLTLTIISLYFEKVILEMKNRPLYIIKNIKRKDD